MKLKHGAIVLRLVRMMKEKGNWCGETHLQKAVYLLQDLTGADTGFEFVLYKHGPFSFDWRDELTTLRADGLLKMEIQPQPYGPKLIPTELAASIEQKFPKTLKKNAKRLEFTAEIVGDKGVSELERLATALFITKRERNGASVDRRASRLHEIKPHIDLGSARDAVNEIDKLIREASEEQFDAEEAG